MRLIWQVAVLAVLAAGGTGAWYLTQGEAAGQQSAQPQMRPVAVEAMPATRGDIAVTFDAVGTVRANEAVTVTSKVAGIVTRIGFEEGQWVEQGAVLVELDDTESRANLAVAEANKRNIAQLLERSSALLGRQAVAQARVDELTLELQGAEASFRATAARLEDLTIRAPFAGITGLRQVSPGALVRPADPITTVDDIRVLKLEFTVPETALRALATGKTIDARASAFPAESFSGVVTVIDTRVDPVTRTIKAVAELPNPTLKLKPGLFMTVGLMVENRPDVVLVPEEALVPSGDRQFVFVVADGKAERRLVQIGARHRGLVEIATGLDEGELVITRGTQKVREGAPVSATVPAAAQTAERAVTAG